MTPGERIKVFLIEDNDADAELINLFLSKPHGAFFFDIERAESLQSAMARLAGETFDIILTDLDLPGSGGIDTFDRVHAAFPHTPIIVLTGLDDEATALEAVQRGAQDYLVKDQISGRSLPRVIRYSLERQKLLTRLEKSLKEIKTLRGLLPMCAWCKNIRDDQGYWKNVAAYIEEHTEAEFTHGICPECLKKVEERYPDAFRGKHPPEEALSKKGTK